jgi:subtilisin-like proprotein convertase family protein
LAFGLLATVLLADGVAHAQDDPDSSPAESSPVEEPGDHGVLAVGGQRPNRTGIVRLSVDNDRNNTYETRVDEFAPYTNPIVGGVRVAMGDFDGDSNDELVTATGNNAPIRVFDIASDGRHGAQLFSFPGFSGGARVATGDIDNDGRDELVVSADHGASTVAIRSDTTNSGLPTTVTNLFNPYAGTRGVRIALGDTDGTAGDELITAMGPGAAGRVKVWHDADLDRQVSDNPVLDRFFPFGSTYTGGTGVSVAFPIDTLGAQDIIVAPESGRKRIRRFDDTDNDDDFSDNGAAEQFFPYGNTYGGGIRALAADTDGSGIFQELIVGPAATSAAKPVRIIDDNGAAPNLYSAGTRLQSLTPYANLSGPVFLGFGKELNDHFSPRSGILPASIPDTSQVNVDIAVPASAGIIRDLNVFLAIQHSFDGDLDVTLTHLATGTSVVLFQDVGGTNDGFIITLDDQASTDISGATNPAADGAITGTFNPGGAALLSAFNSEDASGLWRLTVVDDSGGDTGSVRGFELQLAV